MKTVTGTSKTNTELLSSYERGHEIETVFCEGFISISVPVLIETTYFVGLFNIHQSIK